MCEKGLDSAERLLSTAGRAPGVPSSRGHRAPPEEAHTPRRPGLQPSSFLGSFGADFQSTPPTAPTCAGVPLAGWEEVVKPPGRPERSAGRLHPRASRRGFFSVSSRPCDAWRSLCSRRPCWPRWAASRGSATGEWGPLAGAHPNQQAAGRGRRRAWGALARCARRVPRPAVTFYTGGRGWTIWRALGFSTLNSLTNLPGGGLSGQTVCHLVFWPSMGMEGLSTRFFLDSPPSRGVGLAF